MELVVVMAIIGVLSAIAIPQYTKYVQRGNRVAARGQLLAVAQYLERIHTQTFSYGASASEYTSYLSNVNADSGLVGKYTISVELSETAFTLSATPNDPGPNASDECGTLTVDHRGVKGNSDGSYNTCWGR